MQKYPTSTNTPDGTTSKKSGRSNYSIHKSNAKAEQRRDEAAQRQAEYDSLSTAGKLELIAYRQKKGLDKGNSKREVARLTARLQLEKAHNVTAKVNAAPAPVAPAPAPAPAKEKKTRKVAKSTKPKAAAKSPKSTKPKAQ